MTFIMFVHSFLRTRSTSRLFFKGYYTRSRCKNFSDAYDVYNEIIYRIDTNVQELTLKKASAYYFSVCPSCAYVTDGEPAMRFSLLTAMDGNNSLKRVFRASESPDGSRTNIERRDERTRISPLFIARDTVDEFAHEVQSRRPRRTNDENPEPGSTGARDVAEEGLPIDGHVGESICADRWANLADDSKKRMISIFEETGVFAAVCRHGTVLKACDMIRSGEL